ncbi:tandem-95 repeat protein [Microvirga aerilata]|uniref:Tandem-95 repeat protein n=1 Tax=Microvirga aerilata TaxID=670292 RepID=A0A937CXL0_9HYPH|nr:Calx-beta domain-containing protein [Microvirga aerilata]MBL0405688.1 tandem-95 repeat protein [Microvirga aerilata]
MAAPIVTGDQYTLEQGSILTVAGDTNVLKNDTDADGHPLTAKLLYNAGHGALTFNEDGTFTYKPYDPNWTGEDTFYYTATDGSEVSEPIAVTITVTKATGGGTGGSSTPVAAADTFDMNGAAAQGNVLGNDTNAASAHILYNPSYGALDFKADGSFVYTPYDTYTGEDAFFYTVKDANGVESQPVKVTIKGEKTTTGGGETGGSTGPDANADTITLTHTSGQNYSGSTVLANDANVEGVTPTLVYNPGWGTVTFNADGTFNYVLADWATPANDFKGTDEFFYKVSETEIVKVSLTIPAATGGEEPVGEAAPMAQADTFETVTLDGTRSFTSTTSLLANDTATNGDAMTAEKMWNPGWGSVTVNADGTFTYVLADWANEANGFKGTDEFFYVAKDNDGSSQVVKVVLNNITVPAVEPPPAAEVPEINIVATGKSLPTEVTEGDAVTYTFSRSGDTSAALEINVNVTGTATPGTDHNGAPGKVAFAAGSATATYTVQTTDDLSFEPSETIQVDVAQGNGYTVGSNFTVTTSISDNDADEPPPQVPVVTLSDMPIQANEGGGAVYTFSRTGDTSAELTINVTVGGTATAGQDYTAPATATFAAGSSTAKFTIQTTEDTSVESTETLVVNVAAGNGYTPSGIGAITNLMDNDVAPVLPKVSIGDATAPEGNSLTFNIKLDKAPTSPVTVTYETVHGTTTDGDLVYQTNEVIFLAGQTSKNISIATIEDTTPELTKTFDVKIVSAEGADIADGTGVGTITNDDAGPLPPGNIVVSKTSLAVTEGAATDTFTVKLDSPPTSDVTVTVYTGNELMALGPNGNSNLVFTAQNWNTPQTVTVRSEDDAISEGPHADAVGFIVSSNDARFGDVWADEIPVTITDAGAQPVMPYVSVANKSGNVTEGGEMEFAFYRSDAGDGNLPIIYEMTGLDPSDIAAIKWNGVEGGAARFEGSSQWAYMRVVLADDADIEQAETLTVTLKENGTYLYEDPISATGDVLDNDGVVTPPPELPVLSMAVENINLNEGASASITITLSKASDTPVTAEWATSPSDGTDYRGASGTVTFAPGETSRTITVDALEDTIKEGDEVFGVSISNPVGATITDKPTTYVTIKDNDSVVTPPPPAALTVSAEDGIVMENVDGGQVGFKVKLSAPATSDVLVQWEMSDGSATEGADYANAVSGELWFMEGDTELTVITHVFDDVDVEGDETINFKITGVDGNATIAKATSTVTIQDDDHPTEEEPTGPAGISVSKLSFDLAEGGPADATTVVLTGKPTAPVTISMGSDGGVLFSVNGGEALPTPTLTFTPDNWNKPQTVSVVPVDNAEYQPDGYGTPIYFEPIVTDDPAYQEVFPPSGWATITDNEPAPPNQPPVAMALSTQVWEDNPVADIQGNGYDEGTFAITEYKIVNQPVEGGTVTLKPDGRTFHFEGNKEFLSSMNRGEVKPISFEYAVKDYEGLWSAPEKITFNVHGITNGADETIIATSTTTPSQTDFFPINGGDGNDTVVFNAFALGSGTNSITLGGTVASTPYAGKPIVNVENITLKGVSSTTAGRVLTVNGDDQKNVITVEATNKKLFLNGLGGDDTFDFTGSGQEALTSVITGGAGNDTVNAKSGLYINDQGGGNDIYNFGAGAQHVNFYGDVGSDTITGFTKGVDKLHFLGGQTVTSEMRGTDTVISTSTGGTVTVKNAALTTSDWMFVA